MSVGNPEEYVPQMWYLIICRLSKQTINSLNTMSYMLFIPAFLMTITSNLLSGQMNK